MGGHATMPPPLWISHCKVFGKVQQETHFGDKTIIFWHLCQGLTHANGMDASSKTDTQYSTLNTVSSYDSATNRR